MFSLIININFYLCFYFSLLTTCATRVAAYPARNSSSCNCVLLQSCETFNTFIDNTSDEIHIKTVIQNAVCFFDGLKIFVCCPNKLEHKRNAKEKPKLDYLDDLTGLNCPPSFSSEYDYDEYLKAHESNSKYYNHHSLHSDRDDDNSDYDYDDDDDDDDDDGFNNHDEFTTPEVCNGFGKFGSRNHEYHQHENHDHHRHHHHNHKIHVPFFPPTHTNHYDHDYLIERFTTIKPAKNEYSSCGILPPVLDNRTEVYPWIIRLAYLNRTSRTIRYRCMGAIIGDQHILTAAHCVDQLVPELQLIYARIGDDTNFDDYQIVETIVHPAYNEPLFNNDVAVLKIANNSQSKRSLKQICLPKNDIDTLSGDEGVVAGWSRGGISDVNSSTIRYINLPIMNNTECAIRYAKYSENFETSIVITPTEFCAKDQAMNDVCEGDSGGPFMKRSQSGRYILLGIVAFGPKTNCGQSNLPGVYMRVSSYIDWIKSLSGQQ